MRQQQPAPPGHIHRRPQADSPCVKPPGGRQAGRLGGSGEGSGGGVFGWQTGWEWRGVAADPQSDDQGVLECLQ